MRPRGQNWSSSYHHGGDGGARDGEPQPHCGGGDGTFEQQGTDAEVWYCVELLGEKNSATNPIILMRDGNDNDDNSHLITVLLLMMQAMIAKRNMLIIKESS